MNRFLDFLKPKPQKAAEKIVSPAIVWDTQSASDLGIGIPVSWKEVAPFDPAWKQSNTSWAVGSVTLRGSENVFSGIWSGNVSIPPSGVVGGMDYSVPVPNIGSGAQGIVESSSNGAVIETPEARFTTLSNELTAILASEPLESGVESKAFQFVQEQFAANRSFTRTWLQAVFLKAIREKNGSLATDVVTLVGEFPEEVIYPEGQLIAYGAITNEHISVQKSGIQAFARWASLDSLKYLRTIRPGTRWLNSYLERVVAKLEAKHGASGS